MTEIKLDRLEQNGPRENLELHDISPSQNENTNEIVKKMASLLNVKIDDSQISTSHRLQVPISKRQENSAHPPIIVRFSDRDERNKLFAKRRMLKNNSKKIISAFGSQYISKLEKLTPFRKMLYSAAKNAKQDLNFQFLWTTQGQVGLRRNSSSSAVNVNSLSDLFKLGYSNSGMRNQNSVCFDY